MNSSFQMTTQKLARLVHKVALPVINGYDEWHEIIVTVMINSYD